MAWSRRFVPQSTITRRMNQRDERINRELAARQRTPMEIMASAAMQQDVSVNLLMQDYCVPHENGEMAYERGDPRSGNPHSVGTMPWAAWEMGYRAAEARDE